MEVLLMKMPRADGAALKQEQNVSDQSVGFQEACSPKAMKDEELKCAKAEMGSVKEENERLKSMLDQIQENYTSLQLRFFHILHQQGEGAAPDKSIRHDHEPDELVSLSLGRSSPLLSNDSRKDEKATGCSKMKLDQEIKAGLSLGLVSKLLQLSTKEKIVSCSSPENSFEEPPNKNQKIARNNGDEDQVVQQNYVKRAMVSVRARCDAPTMNDGCQWRKYGQKIAKANPCPRAYYRCTVVSGCPVKKQVQRCVEDMSILITTYEGNHNHPLPVSATAMASTTSAAASMLLSGSSTSQHPTSLSSTPTTTLTTDQLNRFNFSSLHDSSTPRQPFYITNSPLFPTITLDLTGASPSSSSNNYFNSNFPTTARVSNPSASLNFSSSKSNVLPAVWANGCYPAAYGSLPQEQFYQSLLQKNAASSQQSLTETLTKAIISDPSFRSVIAAAISSVAAKPGDRTDQTAENFGQNLLQAISQNFLTQNGKESSCASSYFTELMTSTSSQTGSSPLSSSLPFSIFNSAYTPASDNKELKN